MIKKLKIENFQSHKKTLLEFDPGVNVIIGQSDSGKTAILRALDWVCNNKPSGDDFRSDWGGDTRVSIKIDEGTIIREKKGKTGNSYFFNKTEFKSFNKSVPTEIQEHLNLLPINWQRQHDAPFLLSETGGEVASKLNEIVHLDQIDTSLSRAIAMSRSTSQELTSQKHLQEEATNDLKEFDNVPRMEKMLQVIEQLNIKGNQLDDDHKSILSQINLIKQLDDKVIELQRYDSADIKIHKIINLIEKRVKMFKNSKTLKNAVECVKNAQKVLGKWKHVSDHYDAVLLIVRRLQLNDGYIVYKGTLERLVNRIISIDKRVRILKTEVDELTVKMPDVCPICGGKL